MVDSRKIISKNKNSRNKIRKVGGLGNDNSESTDDEEREYDKNYEEKPKPSSQNLIYVCCLIDSTVAKMITDSINDSIIYLNCNPYNTFGFGWRANTWGDTAYYGGKELYNLFGPEGTNLITSLSHQPEATFDFCIKIISLLKEKNIYVIDSADFDIKPILVGDDGGGWYKSNIGITYPSVIENKGFGTFVNIQSSYSSLDKNISEELNKLSVFYETNFINLPDIKQKDFSVRRNKHIEVLTKAVNTSNLNDNIKDALISVLEGYTAVNEKNEYLKGKSAVGVLSENGVNPTIAGQMMMDWQKWQSGVYYGPNSPPLLHDFVGFLFACTNGDSEELITYEPIPKVSVLKLQEIILKEADAQATEPPDTGSLTKAEKEMRQRNGIMNIIKNVKNKYPNLQSCKVYLDGEADDLLTALAVSNGLKDKKIKIDILFQKSVLYYTPDVFVPEKAIEYKKPFGVTFDSDLAIKNMMKRYDENIIKLNKYLEGINKNLTFSTIECKGLLEKVNRYKGYMDEVGENVEATRIAFFNRPNPEKEGKMIEIQQEVFSNVMANVPKVIVAIDEILSLSSTVGGKSRRTKKRRPTKRKSKKRRPTKRRRHTKRRR